ncbi:hypothetical protein ABKN59_005550 [Abortiporus biennis]
MYAIVPACYYCFSESPSGHSVTISSLYHDTHFSGQIFIWTLYTYLIQHSTQRTLPKPYVTEHSLSMARKTG